MLLPALMLLATPALLEAGERHGMRLERPTRGTYKSPTLPPKGADAVSGNPLRGDAAGREAPLVVPQPVPEDEWDAGERAPAELPTPSAMMARPRGPVVQVAASDLLPEVLDAPQDGVPDEDVESIEEPAAVDPGDVYYGDLPEHHVGGGAVYDAHCDGLPVAPGGSVIGGGASCGIEGGFGPACGWEDCSGCDACSRSGLIALPRLCADGWFGSAEWLLWYRRGQSFPVLAATGEDEDPAEVPLFGGEREGETSESGLRVTVGTWLDRTQCRSATVRLWGLGNEQIDFAVDGDAGLTIVRPFFDVTTLPGSAEENIVVRPDTPDFLRIGFESEVYGGDASIRQLWVRGLGARVDFLYGYQYLRLDERLAIRSRTGGFPDAQLSVTDSFEVENEFHGGQIGLGAFYEEGCWTFHGLAKVGFGNLERRGTLAGTTTTQVGADPAATTNQGLLVRDTNAGSSSDSTFAVSPELSLGLGYRMNHWMDLSIGYSFLMVTDALQTWRTLDNQLAVNLEDPPVDPARPARTFSYGDYWAQGINFGVNFNY